MLPLGLIILESMFGKFVEVFLLKKKKRKEYGCTYGWFLLIYDRKAQKSVKQSSFNKKIIKPERKIPIQYTNAYI